MGGRATAWVLVLLSCLSGCAGISLPQSGGAQFLPSGQIALDTAPVSAAVASLMAQSPAGDSGRPRLYLARLRNSAPDTISIAPINRAIRNAVEQRQEWTLLPESDAMEQAILRIRNPSNGDRSAGRPSRLEGADCFIYAQLDRLPHTAARAYRLTLTMVKADTLEIVGAAATQLKMSAGT